MKDRTGEVWEITLFGEHAELILVVSSKLQDRLHACLVLDGHPVLGRGWKPGSIHNIGEWNERNGWRRIA